MSSADPAPRPSAETYPLKVTLGHQYLSVEAQGTRTIYDFERARILRVDLSRANYSDDSLYAEIGFRALEFRNRLMLGSALRAGKVATNPMEPALMEQLFSLSNPNAQSKIDQRHHEGATEFYWEKHLLMRVSDQSFELPLDYQAEYWRFLRYYAGGHPRAYGSLKTRNGVPAKVSLVLTNMGTETRELALQSIDNVADLPYSLEGLARESREGEPFATLALLPADGQAKLSEHIRDAESARDAALARGDVLEADLLNMSILLMSGDNELSAGWLAQHREAIHGNPLARQLSAGLGATGEDGAKKALPIFLELRSHAGNAAYMLDVFAGNSYFAIRDGKAGAEHMNAALKVNPYLIGAWNDLGGYYFQTFETALAWACWDAARAINPSHFMMKRVSEREQQLRATFPEFF